MAETRRALILDAARSAFFEHGLEGASMREIARRAGYTPGAIYSYFANKEELYGALLGESLERLNAQVAAADSGGAPAERLAATASAFFSFYADNPRDLDLGFYLFRGVRPLGLTPELNRQLNARLRDALMPSEEALRELGCTVEQSQAEVTALFAYSVGVLVLNHTGRIRMFRQRAEDLMQRYLEQLAERYRWDG
ncbi:MAG: TetR/AcrR family transcriptional regulator [Ectothiorhodospiraceae bacterium]|nr:TetR/AcrR family transcriptional regulator [Ectothiorhodospiraceae bacterium]MCH8503962.1 TetR/AcrR family transcriptional regulator [Ectothiorhodospiraceae bacterium]